MFGIVNEFESEIANFFGSPYAIATDCCTHAIELCLRYEGYSNITIPTRTYISIPFTAEKLGIEWKWKEDNWKSYYYLGNTNIIDAAVYWSHHGYISGTYMCLSFQFRKHLNLGRGGIILLDDKKSYDDLKRMSYDGRDHTKSWIDQDISTIGYHYYMTPETAKTGLNKLKTCKNISPKEWSYTDYPFLPELSVFKQLMQ